MKTYKKFLESLHESKTIIYHGDNHNTTKLDPALMNNGNNQEGIGIYFGSLETAKSYGKNIVKLEIQNKDFINARESISKHLKSKVYNLLIKLHKLDTEILYYDCTDWGIEVQEPEDVQDYHIKELTNYLKDEEVRNFQIDYANKFGVQNFVKIWNEVFPNIHGTYYKQYNDELWYAVINTKLKVQPL